MDKPNQLTAQFIKTKDLKTSECLNAAGFKLLDYTNETWVFLNDINIPLTFDNKKAIYTNILTF